MSWYGRTDAAESLRPPLTNGSRARMKCPAPIRFLGLVGSVARCSSSPVPPPIQLTRTLGPTRIRAFCRAAAEETADPAINTIRKAFLMNPFREILAAGRTRTMSIIHRPPGLRGAAQHPALLLPGRAA